MHMDLVADAAPLEPLDIQDLLRGFDEHLSNPALYSYDLGTLGHQIGLHGRYKPYYPSYTVAGSYGRYPDSVGGYGY